MTTGYPNDPQPGRHDQPLPGHDPDPAAPDVEPGHTGDPRPDDGDPGAEGDDDADPALDDLACAPGLVGTLGTRELGDLARRVQEIGRSARNPFGDRLVILAGRLAEFAAEARRRLAADRLPDDAGTPEQQERRREAAGDAAVMTDGGIETFG